MDNDPILKNDPLGDAYKIYYEDENGRGKKAYYNYEKGVAIDKKGNIVNGKFVDQVVKALNYTKSADDKGVIKTIAESNTTIKVKETQDYSSDKHPTSFNPHSKTILWNPVAALKVIAKEGIEMPNGSTQYYNNETGAKQSPALGLFHESVHAYDLLEDKKAYYNRVSQGAGAYTNEEERNVIVNFESPTAFKLHEGVRTNHSGKDFTVGHSDPTSTEEIK